MMISYRRQEVRQFRIMRCIKMSSAVDKNNIGAPKMRKNCGAFAKLDFPRLLSLQSLLISLLNLLYLTFVFLLLSFST